MIGIEITPYIKLKVVLLFYITGIEITHQTTNILSIIYYMLFSTQTFSWYKTTWACLFYWEL